MISQRHGFHTALVIFVCVFAAYCWYVYAGYGQDLYNWSKTFFPYSVRQYLGMSKRYLLQYGHVVFLFLLLVLSRYIFISERSVLMIWPVRFLRKYSTMIFLFHFPILFFLVAVTDYDPADPIHQLSLFFVTLGISILFGKACFLGKPLFDALLKRLVILLDHRYPASTDHSLDKSGLSLSKSHSEFLDLVKIIAMFCVFLGHFSFSNFSTFHIPGFDGAAPRFAVPTFFMISGYFLMLSIDRSKSGPLGLIAKRGIGLYYIVVPMLIVTLLLDTIGANTNPSVYNYSEYYSGVPLQDAGILNQFVSWFQELTGMFKTVDGNSATPLLSDHHPQTGFKGPYNLSEILLVTVSSLAYFNESWLFDLTGLHQLHGGMRAFSNDPFWFMCYLIPFSAMLIIIRLVPNPAKTILLVLWVCLIGLPVLILAPLFFSGSLAYFIHKRWNDQELVKTATKNGPATSNAHSQ